MASIPSLAREFNAIENIDQLNQNAMKLTNFFQTVSGLTKKFKFDDDRNCTTFPKKISKPGSGPNAQKKTFLYNVNNKHEIQALFSRQQHRAVQEIIIGPTIVCEIPQEKVEERYQKLFCKIPKCNILDLPPFVWQSHSIKENDNINIIRDFKEHEIYKKLQAKIYDPLANSRTIGLDKVTYKNLLKADPECILLTSFFNACLRVQAVPAIWKKMFSVLIKNSAELDDDTTELDDNDIKNWRTITMMNTIPKLFQSLIAARLIVWAKNTRRLSPTQKGLLLYNAACESSFILQECQTYAEKNNHDLAVAWLDFSNASDSIPQEAVHHALSRHSIPVPMRAMIESSLKNVETCIRLMFSKTGFTRPFKILKGLPQGSPIIPILLDLVLEPVLRTLAADNNNVFEIFNTKINHFAIPNELVLIADSAAKLQELLTSVENTAKTIGLQFKTNNCSTYHYDNKIKKIKDSSFLFFGQKLTILSQEKIIDYFGVRQGLSIGQNGIPTVTEMIESVDSVCNSKLNIFQKSEAIQNFVMPRAENCLKGLQHVNKEFISEMDKMIQDKFKTLLDIPEDAPAESIVFHCKSLFGDNNIHRNSCYLPLLDLFYIMKIAHAFKMLTSHDDTVKNIAIGSLKAEVLEVIQKKPKNEMAMQDIIKYLSGGLHIKITDNTTVWKTVREATLNLKLKVNFMWKYVTKTNEIQIEIKDRKQIISGKDWSADVSRHLKKALIDYYVREVNKKNTGNGGSNSGSKGGPKTRPNGGLKGKPRTRPTSAPNKTVLHKPPTEKAPFNINVGFPTIYAPQPYMQGLIY